MLDLLSAALRNVVVQGDVTGSPPKAKSLPLDADAVLARLRKQRRLYEDACPFSVGDLITPRADSDLVGSGDPAIVIEVLANPVELRAPDAGSGEVTHQAFGKRLDIRWSMCRGGTVISWLAESQAFEAWTPAHEAAWRAKLDEATAGPKPLTLPEIIGELRDRAAGKEVKAAWKDGDIVEIVNVPEGAATPMEADGLKVGIVARVDATDGTTGVIYHSADSGKMGHAWFRNRDLRKHGPRTVEV